MSTGIYRRGTRLWFYARDEHGEKVCKPTPYNVGEEDLARRYASRAQALLDTRPRAASRKHRSLIYAVQIMPEMHAKRVKIGYTSRPIYQRLGTYRVTCPQSRLLALWLGTEDDEQRVLGLLPGRLGDSELFDFDDVNAALLTIDALLGPRVPRRVPK